ncbi:MAG: TolA protein [Nitrospira sp.]|nr:MAG: TolA protein [Nitrospira sp.]
MTFQALPRHTALSLIGDMGEAGGDRLRKTVVVSLLLHLCLLSVIMGAKFFKKTERPLSAVEVSLVTLPPMEAKPEPKVEKVEKPVPRPAPKPVQSAPIPVPPKPVQTPPPPPAPTPMPVQAAPVAKPAPPAPAPVPAPKLQAPVLAAPQPIPQAAKSPSSAPVTNRADVLRDVMKDVELPTDAPKYGDLAPMKPAEVKKTAQPKLGAPERSDLDAMLKKLNVPDMAAPKVEVPQEPPKPNVAPAKRASLSEEMTSDLDRELQDLKKLQQLPPVKTSEPVREVKPMFREPPPPAMAPPVAASIPRTKPTPMLRVPGVSGSNPYLARVQARISGFWTAPPVDISGKALTVTVRFRLERDGRVGSIVIEQSSGNDYYDMAAQRAVQSAIPLPPFPPDLTDSYFDAHFTFVAGEAAG